MSALVDRWDEERGDWEPDEWDRRVEAVIAERDRVADSVKGDVPLYGSPEWQAADERVKAASQARFERARDVARGKEISDRMARERQERADRIDAEKQVGAGLARMESLPRQVVERREEEREWRKTQPRPSELVPVQREPKERLQPDPTAEAVRRARAACRELAARRAEPTGRVTRGHVDGDGAARVRV